MEPTANAVSVSTGAPVSSELLPYPLASTTFPFFITAREIPTNPFSLA
jgi:hypothetical protein